MSRFTLDVEVDSAAAEDYLDRCVEALTDLRGLPLEEAMTAAQDRVRRRFDRDEIRPRMTDRWRRRKNSRPTLVFEGHLRDSLTRDGSRYAQRTETPDSVTVRSTAPSARHIYRGRQAVDLSGADQRAVVDAFASSLAASLQ